jgi:hypothetical protein
MCLGFLPGPTRIMHLQSINGPLSGIYGWQVAEKLEGTVSISIYTARAKYNFVGVAARPLPSATPSKTPLYVSEGFTLLLLFITIFILF